MRQPMIFRNLMLMMTAVAAAAGFVVTKFYEPPPGFPLPAAGKVDYGVQLDHEFDTITGYAQRLGSTPAIYGRYLNFPISPADQGVIGQDVEQLAAVGSSLMLTLEPREDLTVVTPEALKTLTENLTAWNAKGVPVLVRFAHEMNGSWYPWGQQPALFVKKYREVAEAVHQAPSSAMLWSPNEGSGYPFTGGEQEAASGSAELAEMDTDGDGMLTREDDPYAPYWPGDDYVDWVGLSLYHFGDVYPWGANVIPEEGKLAQKISGTFRNVHVDDSVVPNFYEEYSEAYDKPFVISETAAFFNTSRADGASGVAIKEAWWKQLFDAELGKQFPRLQMVLWFEFSKVEKQPGAPVIDWRTTEDPTTRALFADALPDRFSMSPLRR